MTKNSEHQIRVAAPEARSCAGSEARSRTSRTFEDFFHGFALRSSRILGSPWAFLAATVVTAVWGCTGPWFGFSDAWQLVINTSTTIVTFLMVFLIQNSQNRDAQAIRLKLDELLRAIARARTDLINLDDLSDQELRQLEQELRAEGQAAAAKNAGTRSGQRLAQNNGADE